MAVMTANLVRTRNTALDVRRVQIVCSHRGKSVQFEAMIDSGNTLRDYLTQYPVIVMSKAAGMSLFGMEEERLRPIFADTAGGRQMMSIFVPSQMQLVAGGKNRKIEAAVAFCEALSKEAPILAPASLLHDE